MWIGQSLLTRRAHFQLLFFTHVLVPPMKSFIPKTESYSSMHRNSSQLSAEEIEALTLDLEDVAVEVSVLSSILSPSQTERESTTC